ncbi:mRNA cleavage and polyadenylation specificity factor complex subunit-like protein [Emericellopsis cladophorae]|uniref:mRNA cleavage and polyadenylation specificity factor complex subunit-like protein n=1 Tax=Emericellopsis cladophorae TaxID=2686198 RepID=A0A9P9Y6A7_9HYPO|nr:mRNA cleavage and polyadenylation specificity factor complex subunit-like protein [Emericellopsis cladophorae]KAI6783719.1 mRNA cleavage and polyadenylation specificity factor complex subunit-like protein [Emericellopsis cladophorae]
MSATALSIPEQIHQLNDARKLVLSDVKHYPNVVRGIVPVIKGTSALELRRWGADFLAEAFATPALPTGEKETMQPYVMEWLESILNNEKEDIQVLRSVIQTAASIYPLAMRWTINNSYDKTTWDRMMAIKQRILQIWDTSGASVKICCIKFAQRVVLAQSVTAGHEARYGGTLDVSLDKVPSNHQLLSTPSLEAEADGPMTSKQKVMVRSMEKTTRILLIHLSKRDPHNPMVPRIQQHVERMMRAVADAFDGTGKKRQLEASVEEAQGVKRQRLVPAEVTIPPLGSGPHSLADVYALTDAAGLRSFDISQVPSPLIAKLAVSTLARIDPQLLDKSIAAVRDRLQALATAPAPEINANTAPLGVDDDDDDYEPDFFQAEDTEQILNKLDGAPVGSHEQAAVETALGLKTFHLPQPPQLSPELALTSGNDIVTRVLDMTKTMDEPGTKKGKAGFARLAASSGIRESWLTIVTRLATRSSGGLERPLIKGEDDPSHTQSLSENIRDVLYSYIMEDFRKHIDISVSWLTEEWYNDKMQSKAGGDQPMHYEECALRLIDGFLPFVHPQDKVLTRFLSELPELNDNILARVKSLCKDPSIVQLALTSLLYLVMMRPPIKELALDTVQDIWTEYEEARPIATKYLTKYRPDFIQAANEGTDNTTAVTT